MRTQSPSQQTPRRYDSFKIVTLPVPVTRAPSVFLFCFVLFLFFNVSLVLLIVTMNGACEVDYFSEVFSYGRIFAILTFFQIF